MTHPVHSSYPSISAQVNHVVVTTLEWLGRGAILAVIIWRARTHRKELFQALVGFGLGTIYYGAYGRKHELKNWKQIHASSDCPDCPEAEEAHAHPHHAQEGHEHHHHDEVHVGCGDAVERLSGVKQPTALKVTMLVAVFLYHMAHKLMHTFNIYMPLAGYILGCWGAKKVNWVRKRAIACHQKKQINS